MTINKQLFAVDQEFQRLRQKISNQKRELRRLAKIDAGYSDALRVQRVFDAMERRDEAMMKEVMEQAKAKEAKARDKQAELPTEDSPAVEQLSFAFGRMVSLGR